MPEFERTRAGPYRGMAPERIEQMDIVKVVRNEQFFGVAMAMLEDAQSSVDICTYKFEFSTRPAARELSRLILRLYTQAAAGIPVRVLLNTTRAKSGLTKINEHAARELKKMGVDVRTLPDGRCQHAKTLVVDNCAGIVGSHNWSPKSLTENYEVSIALYHAGYIQEIQAHFEKIWAGATKL